MKSQPFKTPHQKPHVPQIKVISVPINGVALQNGGVIAPVKVDLDALADWHEGLFTLHARCATAAGTAPGANRKLTLTWGFLADDLSAADVNALGGKPVSGTLDVPVINSAAGGNAGLQYQHSDPFLAAGPYLCVWASIGTLDANSTVTVTVSLVRI